MFRTVNRRLVALLLALAIAPAPSAAAPPLRIGAALSLTGAYASLGQNQQRGYQLCARQLNERGGVLGRAVELVLYDDRSDPTTGIRLYEKLITQDRVELVLGPLSSPVTEAVANVTEKYRMPMVAPTAGTTSIFRKGRQWIFMVLSAAEEYLDAVMELAAKRGLRTVALLNEDTLFSKAAAKGGVDAAARLGLRVVFADAYPKGTTDFAALLTKVRAVRPDVLAAATFFDDAVAITRQMRELAIAPSMYAVTVGGDLPRFYEMLGRSAEGVYGTSQWEAELHRPGSGEFVDAYRRAFPGADLSYHAAAGHAGCMVLAEAVRRAGATDPERVRTALLRLDMETPFGRFKVDATGFQVAHRMLIFQWQEGRKVIVWPPELAQGAPR